MKTYEELFTEEAVRDLQDSGLDAPAKEEMTCNGCPAAEGCEYAWDLYNTKGDCLANK